MSKQTCCLDHRVGAVVTGSFDIIAGFLAIAVAILRIYQESCPLALVFTFYGIFGAVIAFLSGAWLLVGAKRNSAFAIQVHLAFSMIGLVWSVLFLITYVAMYIVTTNLPGYMWGCVVWKNAGRYIIDLAYFIVTFVSIILGISIKIYLWFCMKGYSIMLKNKVNTLDGNVNLGTNEINQSTLQLVDMNNSYHMM